MNSERDRKGNRGRRSPASGALPAVDRRRTVVVIDDHRDLLEAIVEQLDHAGWTARGFSSVDAALPFIRASLPDVVLTDINVGRFSGAAIAREIRLDRATADIPVVAMSGTTEPTPHMLALFDHFLRKPVELARISDLLRSAIERRAGR